MTWTYIIDGPAAKLKLTVHEAVTPKELDEMIAGLQSLKRGNVLPDDDPFEAVEPEQVRGITFDGHEFPVSEAFVRELKGIYAQMKARGIKVKPSQLDVEDPSEEESSYDTLNNLFNAVLAELSIQPHQDPVIKAREIIAELRAATTGAEDDSEVFSEPVRDRTQNDPWYGAHPGINTHHFMGPQIYQGVRVGDGEEAKVEIPAGHASHLNAEHTWTSIAAEEPGQAWTFYCVHHTCPARLYIRKRPTE